MSRMKQDLARLDRQRAYRKGLESEALVVDYLEGKGYDIMDERYKTKFGEIDIIARDDEYLVFTEVKARGSYAEGAEAVNYRARRRIEQAALYYLSQNEAYNDVAMRFDVIVVVGDKMGGVTLHHLDHAWEAGQ